jgi:hypothetical protein
MYIYHIFFIYSSADEHLGFFRSLAIFNGTVINRVCRYLYCVLNYIPLDICPIVVSQVYKVVLF